MNINLLVHFVALLDELDDAAEAIVEFKRLMRLYGFEYFGVIRTPRPTEDLGSFMLAGHWPAGWPENYMRRRYMQIDPTLRYLGHAKGSFRWRDALPAFRADPLRKRMERMMVDARQNGLADGYIFPVHSRRGLLGGLSLGSAEPVELHPAEMGLFDTIARRLFWQLLNDDRPDVAAQLSAALETPLTRREMEALSLLADGMTSNEIANVLGISRHTVDWYMNGIQQKLAARNRHHAVALAFQLGLVS